MFAQNYPLYIKTIPTDNELKFYYTVHTSLDVVEEKVSSVGKNTNDLRELYLGLLYPTEDYKVYPSERKMLLFVCVGVKKITCPGSLVGWSVVFNVPSTARSFRDGAPIYSPLRRM